MTLRTLLMLITSPHRIKIGKFTYDNAAFVPVEFLYKEVKGFHVESEISELEYFADENEGKRFVNLEEIAILVIEVA
ncbi:MULTISPECIES: hypothetical protein [unclassified Enterococcus]|uniref:hypothetical protein n=1 Tax=unclassified Enterococcus TaxID=2608891 RepID=UPI0015553F03|nr:MULTISPECIES: hypothetical protein [unclassified Enterococcus]MBS7578486.1 hypothetical protein [Enterococcus sp. MMGLQ5-2]MBS7585719.1 hypothetical protein [Enterococcus sp. MMGLQ5-1]NPD13578.1 hypothetical protein [Enterococcus sp. MMGLQ5-1]NPD38320.1 hypothetical protein [Enterococcus sp. MMGLQ5-2]